MQASYKISATFLITLSFTVYFLSATAQDSLIVPGAKKRVNSIGINYDMIGFDKTNSTASHLLSVEYTRRTKKMPLIARINYANRFSKPGLQFEAEAYPAISKKIYTYVNAGYSNDVLLFPKYRAGASLYVSLPHAFEAEAGFRVLYFSSPTWIYTTGIGKYHKNYWFYLSAFLTPAKSSVSQSYFATCRYYINDKDYIMLLVGTGISPDDRNNSIQLGTENKLSAKKAELSIKKTFYVNNVFLFKIGFLKQEYGLKKYTHQFNAGIGFQKMF